MASSWYTTKGDAAAAHAYSPKSTRFAVCGAQVQRREVFESGMLPAGPCDACSRINRVELDFDASQAEVARLRRALHEACDRYDRAAGHLLSEGYTPGVLTLPGDATPIDSEEAHDAVVERLRAEAGPREEKSDGD